MLLTRCMSYQSNGPPECTKYKCLCHDISTEELCTSFSDIVFPISFGNMVIGLTYRVVPHIPLGNMVFGLATLNCSGLDVYLLWKHGDWATDLELLGP
jgi:hypothetical protein